MAYRTNLDSRSFLTTTGLMYPWGQAHSSATLEICFRGGKQTRMCFVQQAVWRIFFYRYNSNRIIRLGCYELYIQFYMNAWEGAHFISLRGSYRRPPIWLSRLELHFSTRTYFLDLPILMMCLVAGQTTTCAPHCTESWLSWTASAVAFHSSSYPTSMLRLGFNASTIRWAHITSILST